MASINAPFGFPSLFFFKAAIKTKLEFSFFSPTSHSPFSVYCLLGFILQSQNLSVNSGSPKFKKNSTAQTQQESSVRDAEMQFWSNCPSREFCLTKHMNQTQTYTVTGSGSSLSPKGSCAESLVLKVVMWKLVKF